MDKPRVGHIKFINCLPLACGFAEGGYDKGLTITEGTPAALNEKAINGELDITPVSSIIYARHPEKFLLLPGLSISADGALQSILLVANKPIHLLDGCRVALTEKSATSHGQLQIVLDRLYGLQPEYFISSRSLDEGVLDEADAALFIGDDALNAYHYRQEGLYYYDMGAEWRKLTGSSMVYAVWVVKRDFARDYPEQVAFAHRQLTGGFRYGLANMDKTVELMQGKTRLEASVIRQYITLLNYDMEEEHKKALCKYYRFAYELGLAPAVPELEFFGAFV